MKKITNKFKLAVVAIGMLVGTVSAQNTDATTLIKDADATKTVKLIDNKGTIKYLQSSNGITQITSTAPGNRTTTTWQLGGELTDNTYITAKTDGSAEFALDGLELVTDATTASTDATDRSIHGVGTGFTVLIRNEVSGAIQKIKLTDLLKVEAVYHVHTQGADATADVAIVVAGLPALNAASVNKLFVFRNGAKLRHTTDFDALTTAGTVSIKYDATELPMYTDDVIEIQYIK